MNIAHFNWTVVLGINFEIIIHYNTNRKYLCNGKKIIICETSQLSSYPDTSVVSSFFSSFIVHVNYLIYIMGIYITVVFA